MAFVRIGGRQYRYRCSNKRADVEQIARTTQWGKTRGVSPLRGTPLRGTFPEPSRTPICTLFSVKTEFQSGLARVVLRSAIRSIGCGGPRRSAVYSGNGGYNGYNGKSGRAGHGWCCGYGCCGVDMAGKSQCRRPVAGCTRSFTPQRTGVFRINSRLSRLGQTHTSVADRPTRYTFDHITRSSCINWRQSRHQSNR